MTKREVIHLAFLCILVFLCLAAPVAAAGLTIEDGAMITATDGVTSPVITITDSPIAQDSTITIDVSTIRWYFTGFSLNDANIVINSNASLAVWTCSISGDGNTLTLMSTGGPTAVHETVTVSLKGTAGNPWGDSDGYKPASVTVTRTDGAGFGAFLFTINTSPVLKGLTITDGSKITAVYGATSPVITITDLQIAQDGTIIIDVSSLNLLVANNALTDTNVIIDDTAAIATWTGKVAGDILTLTSTGGATDLNETVTVTFKGTVGNPWIAYSGGRKLTATRSDGKGASDFNVELDTVSSGSQVADFSAFPTLDIAPLSVTFTDKSTGNPILWNWSFGDGNFSALKNPSYTYSNAGKYTVSLTATDVLYGPKTKTQSDYITVLNGVIREVNTSITGLTVSNCGGPQTVTVDTSILPAAFIPPNNFVLEIRPPGDRGFNKITLYALDEIGFLQSGNLITGNPTGVHLVTEQIRPSPGFSDDIGTKSSFNYSVNLSSFPCNAILSTKIWEGVIPEYDTKFRQIASENNADPVGTAYTAKITRTNFPSGAPAKVYMSVNSSWKTSLGGDHIFIWRISEDGNSGQILPTSYLYTDTVNNLDYYEANSPLGLSTFGISATIGNNNPFQLVTFAIAQVISPPDASANTGNSDSSASNTVAGAGKATAPAIVQNVNPPKALAPPDPGKTEKIYTNAEGVITQETLLLSTDELAQISIGLGVVAKDSQGAPLTSVTLTAMPEESLPPLPSSASYTFAGMAYNFEPDGATFSPAVSLSFNYPQATWAGEYSVKSFDPQSGTWQDLPTIHDPGTGKITAQVSHFCTIALFVKSSAPSNPVAVFTPGTTVTLKAPSAPAPTAISNFIGMILWIVNLMAKNILIIAGIIILALAIFLYGRKRRRDEWMYRP